jgi:hypothetical protein
MSVYQPTVYFDAPKVLSAAVTLIPKSSSPPLQIIADSGNYENVGMDFRDSTDEFIGVYIGGAGEEQLSCIVGGGISGMAFGIFPPHSRVSLRAMENTDITNGKITGNLVRIRRNV